MHQFNCLPLLAHWLLPPRAVIVAVGVVVGVLLLLLLLLLVLLLFLLLPPVPGPRSSGGDGWYDSWDAWAAGQDRTRDPLGGALSFPASPSQSGCHFAGLIVGGGLCKGNPNHTCTRARDGEEGQGGQGGGGGGEGVGGGRGERKWTE
eukprot:5702093-Pyramimonas_sp.AAC.1